MSDLSRRLELAKSTVHSLLAMLREYRWVERHASGRYGLALRAFEIGAVVAEQRAPMALMPRAEELAHATHEAVSLAVLDGDEAVVVRRIESPQLLRTHLKLGGRMPLTRSASGKALLAHMPPARAERFVLGDAPLLEELAAVRAFGYSVSRDGTVAGVSAISTPVFGPTGAATTALTLSAPSPRFDPAKWVEPLLEAGRDLSRIAGGAAFTH